MYNEEYLMVSEGFKGVTEKADNERQCKYRDVDEAPTL